MKKAIAVILAVVMVLSLGLTACGGSKSSSSDGNATSAPAESATSVQKISMATGGTSGTYYGFSGVVAQVLNGKLKGVMDIAVESTGASKANIQLIDSGADQLAIVQNDVMYYAYTATDMFEGEKPITNFSAVISCYPEVVQIIANKNITSIADLKGKNVSVGDAGSGTEFNAKQILRAYGIEFSDINVSNLSFADSADSIKNGTIDAAFVVAGTPTTAVTELSTSYEFNLLEVDDEHVAALQKEYGFYAKVTVPGGTYSCVTEDKQAVAVMATIIASNSLSEDLVYQFVKALFDNKDEIAQGHTKGAELDPATAVSGISIPFHPGAEKYYKEIGAL
ncbi:MAG: TAXI family TRAP transporter solute-binding subunit [Oscillospiraceae bacterium]|nr:TAXI family TRAP transporter solute-binding subunit [Oscillospiraceae bacterium]